MTENRAGNNRRAFIQGGAAAVAGARALRGETLALEGGPKAVTMPPSRVAEITRWPRYGDEEKRAVIEMMEGNKFYPEIPLLEKELAEQLKVPYAKAHCNGTSALISGFFALDLPRGSEILAPSFTAWATTAPMHLFGYVPVFVDISPRTMTFDLAYAKKKLTARTRAIVPQHSFGNPCDMDEICAFAKERGLLVMEDAAQAQGASLKGKAMGTWGDIGAYSFQSSKIIPAVEGGAGVYQTREHYERATMFGAYELASTFPQDSPYRTYAGTGMGPKFRIHPLGAALARWQLRRMEASNELADRQVRKLTDRLVELPGLSRPYTRPDARRVYWSGHMLFVDEAKVGCKKDTLIKALRAEGVVIGPGKYDEQHTYRLYSEAKWWHHPVEIPTDLVGTAQVNRTSIKLPVFHAPADELIEQYFRAFEKVWAKRAQLAQS